MPSQQKHFCINCYRSIVEKNKHPVIAHLINRCKTLIMVFKAVYPVFAAFPLRQ